MTTNRPPLTGLEVLEVGELECVHYAGRILAELGADVTLLEPPGGAAMRRRRPFASVDGDDLSIPFEFYCAGKRSLVVAGESPREVEGAVAVARQSDVVLLDPSGRWLKEAADGDLGRAVWCAASPFGWDLYDRTTHIHGRD